MPDDTETLKRISHNVSRLLAEREWTQAQLAAETEETEMNISRVVRGRNMPGAGLLSRIAEAFGVAVDDLLKPTSRFSKKTA